MTNTKKTAAIMFTDMKGYSALTQQDETLALEVLDIHTELLTPILKKYNGRLVKTIGDAFMIEFSDGLKASLCAIDMQLSLKTKNKTLKKKRRMLMRIGIHFGNVTPKGDDIFGDDVNIAARLEPIATPGKISISKAVYDQVSGKISYVVKNVGNQKLKNITSPISIYEIDPYKKNNFIRTIVANSRLIVATLLIALGYYYYKNPSFFQKHTRNILRSKSHNNKLQMIASRIELLEQTGFDVSTAQSKYLSLNYTDVSSNVFKSTVIQIEEHLKELELKLAGNIEERKSKVYQKLKDREATEKIDKLLKDLDQKISQRNWKEAHSILFQIESNIN